MSHLEASFALCRAVTRGSNFRNAFLLLEDGERDAISAIYAFMRRCDDLSDEPGATVAALEEWRGQLREALEGSGAADPIWPAFRETVRRYEIPHRYFHEHIDGVSSDLGRSSIATFDELYQYCYGVASVAGLCLMHIFGNRSAEALHLAEKCGIAFQLTNVIRDVKEDKEQHGRVYVPREDLDRFGVTELKEGPAFFELMRFEAARARELYDVARPLPKMVSPRCGRSLWALIETYSLLLEKIESLHFPVLRERVRLSKPAKLGILARALWQFR